MNTWTNSLLSLWAICIIIVFTEMVEQWRHARKDIDLGKLPSGIKAWQRMRRDYLLSLRHTRQEDGSWRKKVQVMGNKIRDVMVVSAHGAGDPDDAVTPHRRPHRQHPDMEEVERFLGHDDPIAYLRSSAGRSEPPDHDDYSPLLTAKERRDSYRAPPPKSGTQARQASVIPIRRRRVG